MHWRKLRGGGEGFGVQVKSLFHYCHQLTFSLEVVQGELKGEEPLAFVETDQQQKYDWNL